MSTAYGMARNGLKAGGSTVGWRYTMLRMKPDAVRLSSGMFSIKLESASSTVA